MRIGIAQVNPVLGDFSSNRKKILQVIRQSAKADCQLCVFPEAALFGYHPFDLLERRELVERELRELATIHRAMPAGTAAIFGVITQNPERKGRPYYNSAVLLQKDQPAQFFHKQLLPTGDVFDEARFIESGDLKKNKFTIHAKGKTLRGFVTICEDIWAWPEKDGSSQYDANPLLQVRGKFDLVVNLSASPFYPGKLARREDLVARTARHLGAPMVYVNMVGAQDEIVFDGASFALDTKGKKILQAPAFSESFSVLDLERKTGEICAQPKTAAQGLRQALVLGIRDFCAKLDINKIHLGLSGGIDSALVACLAVEALGQENVTAVAMPGPFSSPKSLKLAAELASGLQIRLLQMPIHDLYEVARQTVETRLGLHKFSTVHENLQARARGMLLMALANAENSLLLSTSNKSEYASGYATLYGDMCGGLAPIGDLTKQQVYEMSRLYPQIPQAIIERAPTAELRRGQKDQDSLPPYEKLDESVRRIVEECAPAKTATDKWLMEKVLQTEFKRWQAPPILKVSRHSFGRGRRYPIAQRVQS